MSEEVLGTVQGLSLPTFLQMMAMENKSCTLIVNSGSRQGKIFLENGELLTASYDDKPCLDALYSILSWQNPEITVAKAEKVERLISESLAGILLAFSAQQDEKIYQREQDSDVIEDADIPKIQFEPADEHQIKLLLFLDSLPKVKKLCMLNKKGQVISSSFGFPQEIADYMVHLILTGTKLNKTLLSEQGLQYIISVMKKGGCLLVLSGGGGIIGIQVESEKGVDEIVAALRKFFKKNKK